MKKGCNDTGETRKSEGWMKKGCNETGEGWVKKGYNDTGVAEAYVFSSQSARGDIVAV